VSQNSEPSAPRPLDAGDVVRPFVMTRGRTRATDSSLRIETMVQTAPDAQPQDAEFENARILLLCGEPFSVAEVASKLGVPLGVAMVLVSDLVAQDCLVVHHSDPVDIELSVLTRMINRVRTL
jgi:hypothetical protein